MLEIVTLTCRDDEKFLETTKSLKNLKNLDIIWTVIDCGHSEIVKKTCENVNMATRIINDSGKGIYHAMNIAIKNSNAEYIWFLNSGDQLLDSGSLREVISVFSKTDSDIIICGYQLRQKKISPKPVKSIRYRMPTSHQAIFYKVKNHKKYYFDTKYTLCADYHVLKRMWLHKCTFNSIDVPIVQTLPNGVSDLNRTSVLREMIDINKRDAYALILVTAHGLAAIIAGWIKFRRKVL